MSADQDDPMARLIELALAYETNTSAWPHCECNVAYHHRLFKEDELTPIYCVDHDERSDTA